MTDSTKFQGKEYRKWKKEKQLIPVMIQKYCHGKHHSKGKSICPECQKLTDYSLYRLSLCPFKKKKDSVLFAKSIATNPRCEPKLRKS